MYAAVDVGGTKTLVAALNNHGRIKEQRKFATPADYLTFTRELAKNVANLSTQSFQAVGFAVPGKVDRKHGVGLTFGNLPWENVPIQAEAERIFHAPAIIENDANLAGLSEAIALKEPVHKVLYVTISTGIGGGVITNKKIDRDFEDIEIGHMLLEHGDRLQRWEEFASGKAISDKFGKPVSEINDAKAWYVIARNLAIGFINLIAVLGPDIIIIGGGVGSHFKKFEQHLVEELKIYENPLVTIPPLRQATHAEEAVIYGCYYLAKEKYSHGA